jgi:hypothetical protein
MDFDNLSKDEKEKLACNPNTPPEALAHLADDENGWVRWMVAKNPNTPPEALVRLAVDGNVTVRWFVARNPSTPEYVRDYLNAMEFVRFYGN